MAIINETNESIYASNLNSNISVPQIEQSKVDDESKDQSEEDGGI